jgi:hypothetical protein
MTIPYRINGIKATQFAIFPETYTKGTDVQVSSEFNFSITKEKNSIRCTSTYNYLQNGNLLMKLELQCFFNIAHDGIEEIQKRKLVPKDFLRYMATIVVGTARGYIFARTEGTELNSIILPPINLVDGINNDLPIAE